MLTDGRTNGRTDERTKLARLSRPAKAGATKNTVYQNCGMDSMIHQYYTGEEMFTNLESIKE